MNKSKRLIKTLNEIYERIIIIFKTIKLSESQ